MTELTAEGEKIVADIAQRHGISTGAARQMLEAVANGQGSQAQFNISELGGMGQWSRGGMTMVSDMFNHGLAARVDALCSELSGIVGQHTVFGRPAASQSQSSGGGMAGGSIPNVSLFVPAASDSWPESLGQPASVGSQNNMRYAYFPATRRLALSVDGKITVYDTGDHQISGFGQAQSGGQSLSFTSQHGLINLSDLKEVRDADQQSDSAPAPVPPVAQALVTPAPEEEANAPLAPPAPAPAAPPARTTGDAMSDDQIFDRIERLAGLFEKGILTQSEYETKKAELLSRL